MYERLNDLGRGTIHPVVIFRYFRNYGNSSSKSLVYDCELFEPAVSAIRGKT